MSVATVYGTTFRSAPCSAHSGIGLLSSFPITPVERLAVSGAVQVPEHVVEGTVLEQHHDDVVERVGAGS